MQFVKNGQNNVSYWLVFLFFLVPVGLLLLFKAKVLIFVLFVLFFLWILSYHLNLGLYVLAFLAPMMHWTFYLNNFRFLFEDYPQLLGFFAPVVDVWAVVLLLAFVLYAIRQLVQGKDVNLRLPGINFYGLFLLSAVFSLTNVLPGELWSSVKYIIRFPLFVYLGYVVLGTSIIHSKQIWENTLKSFLMSTTLGAFMGFASILLGVWGLAGFRRAVPFAIGGWMPFGDQHIFLAEILVVAILIALYFLNKNKQEKNKNLQWISLIVFLIFICLATLSRAGWLTLFVELTLFVYLFRTKIDIKKIYKKILLAIILLSPFLLYMAIFLTTKVVTLSNAARFALTEISWYLFELKFILGQGVGTFIARVSEINYFVYEFGIPIDAHSVVSKIMSEQGLVGLITFGLFVFWIIKNLYKNFNPKNLNGDSLSAALGILMVVGILFFQLFSTQYYSAKMWVPIMLAISSFLVCEHCNHLDKKYEK